MRELDTFQLVLSKFNPPVSGNKCVDRPRLLSSLDRALSRRLCLISAPAGYGKTTIVAQWLKTIPYPSAWLTLDEHDRDLGRFLRYLVGSLNTASPKLGHDLHTLLSATKMPPMEVLSDSLLADLSALEEPLVLVVDDLHLVGPGPLQVLNRLVHYLPDHLHLVAMTRVDPSFPLAAWRVKGWLAEIRSDDLRFAAEEARLYIKTFLDHQVPDDVVEQIITQTEGWAVGIQLAALSLGDGKTGKIAAAPIDLSGQNIIDFMMQEVYARQPAEIKDFLVVTSVLKRFCAPLCNYLLSSENHARNSVRIIAYLQKHNLFLVSLDSGSSWHRYHNLFQQFLVQQLEEVLPPNRQAQIFRNAGQWCADHDAPDEGLEYFIKGGDLDAAADLVGAEMHALIDDDNSRFFLSQWLELFPGGAEKKRPNLLLAQAYMKIIRWDLAGIEHMLDEAETLLQVSGRESSETRRQTLLGDIEVLRAFCLYWKGDPEGALHNARLYLARKMPWKHQYAYTLAISYAAGSSALCGRIDEALLLLESALEADCKEGSHNTAHLLMVRAVIHLYRVDFTELEENVRKALIVHERIPQPDYWMGYVPYLLGCIAYEKNLLPEAADYFSQVAENMRYRVNPRMYHDTLIGLMLIARDGGEIEKSTKYGDEAFAFAIEVKDPLSIHFSELIRVRCAILSGDAPPDPPQRKMIIGSNLFWLESPTLIHAEFLINKGTRGDCSTGLEMIDESLSELQHHCNVRQEIQYLAAKALALWHMGEDEEALEVLEESLFMAKPHELVRPFVNRGPLMAEPLDALLSKQPRNQYLKTLVKLFRKRALSTESINVAVSTSLPQTILPPGPSIESDLTNREFDILELLRKRLTNKEIAEELNISPITVKSHSINIYRKLQVHGRRQAVEKAVQLNLLKA